MSLSDIQSINPTGVSYPKTASKPEESRSIVPEMPPINSNAYTDSLQRFPVQPIQLADASFGVTMTDASFGNPASISAFNFDIDRVLPLDYAADQRKLDIANLTQRINDYDKYTNYSMQDIPQVDSVSSTNTSDSNLSIINETQNSLSKIVTLESKIKTIFNNFLTDPTERETTRQAFSSGFLEQLRKVNKPIKFLAFVKELDALLKSQDAGSLSSLIPDKLISAIGVLSTVDPIGMSSKAEDVVLTSMKTVYAYVFDDREISSSFRDKKSELLNTIHDTALRAKSGLIDEKNRKISEDQNYVDTTRTIHERLSKIDNDFRQIKGTSSPAQVKAFLALISDARGKLSIPVTLGGTEMPFAKILDVYENRAKEIWATEQAYIASSSLEEAQQWADRLVEISPSDDNRNRKANIESAISQLKAFSDTLQNNQSNQIKPPTITGLPAAVQQAIGKLTGDFLTAKNTMLNASASADQSLKAVSDSFDSIINRIKELQPDTATLVDASNWRTKLNELLKPYPLLLSSVTGSIQQVETKCRAILEAQKTLEKTVGDAESQIRKFVNDKEQEIDKQQSMATQLSTLIAKLTTSGNDLNGDDLDNIVAILGSSTKLDVATLLPQLKKKLTESNKSIDTLRAAIDT